MDKQYDVGIVGCWYWGNYGSLLNGYATFNILKSFGLKPLNIISPYNGFEPHAKKLFNAVYKDNDISELYPFERLHEFNNICNSFLTGSDQIWNYRSKDNTKYDEFFRLNFANESKRKISFATSFGNYHKEPDDVMQKFKKLYERYSAISVREQEGVDILKEYYSIDATQVMEPVLDVPVNVWYELSEHSEYHENEPYIFTYILDPTEEKRKSIQYYSEKSGMKAINMLDGFSGAYLKNKEKLNLPNILPNIWCADMLKYYSNAQFIITDSFHGVCFAIAFNKPFIAIGNYGRGIKRFETLLSKFNLTDRLIYDSSNIPLNDSYLSDIDYTYANSVLSSERKKSIDWLKNAFLAPLNELKTIKLNCTDKAVTVKLSKDQCIGCGACVSICAKNALNLKPDEYGYYISNIDNSKCINCGACSDVCPALKLPDNKNLSIPDVYEFISNDDDLLYNSSSGGFFTQAARIIFEKKGAVIGAAWKEDFSVEHIVIESEDELQKLRKSKYLQSYSGNIDKKVKDLLDNDRYVLFSGTPCQVAGLRKYLKKDYEKLLIIDIFCSNAPSALFFKKYIDEKFNGNLKSYEFRNKSKGYNCLTISVTDNSDNVTIFHGAREDNYQRVYHNHIMTPKHCEKCRYQSLKRYGDFSIGDFWWLDKHDKETDQSKGINILLVNNDKAKAFLENIPSENIRVLKKVPAEWTGGNAQTKSGIYNGAHPKRDAFYKAILTMPFSKAIDYAMKPNHGLYPGYKEKSMIYSTSLFPNFSFDRNVWEQHIIKDKTVLVTRQNKPAIGKYATIPLCKNLEKGKQYLFKIRFKIHTDDTIYNFHVKDSGSRIFQVILSHRISMNDNNWIKNEIVFSPDADFYDEFMIGAAQLKGEDAYILFDYIEIYEI